MHQRYAVYYAPPAGSALARLGAAWLGRDAETGVETGVETGAEPARPAAGGPALADLTAAPRRYGLHATLKPPMRLAEGRGLDDLLAAARALAAGLAPVELGRLRLGMLDGFLALVPAPQTAALERLAAEVVAGLDHLRAPPGDGELARRRAAGLSPRQEALLARWGYPYVMEEFRFHITLTGPLAPELAETVRAAAADHFASALDEPQRLADLAVFGERPDGVFDLITRVPLSG